MSPRPGSEVTVRGAEERDVAALSALATATYKDAFGHSLRADDLAFHLDEYLSPLAFARVIAEDSVLLADDGDQLIGFVQFGAAPSTIVAAADGDQELRRLYVRTDLHNQGIGTRLMEAALDHPRLRGAGSIFLDVWEHNDAAQRFYRRYDFEAVGTRRFEVPSGAATSLDVIMVRRAPPGDGRAPE